MTDEERAATEALAREEAEAQAEERDERGRDDGMHDSDGRGTRDLVAERQDETDEHGHEPGEAPRSAAEEASSTPLFGSDAADTYRGRWQEIQARFVDDPQKAVEEADVLVAELMKELARMFANERSGLERQWERGADASTEDLRVALRRYRSFFSRLLTI